MKYLHFIHINKNWYYWFDKWKNNKTFRPYEGDGSIDESLIWFAGNDKTKSNAKQILKEMFPKFDPILTYPYHSSPRLDKNGSRPYKTKDNHRRIREFFKETRHHISPIDFNKIKEERDDNMSKNDVNVKIKYFTNDIDKIEKISKGDWIDLRAAEDITIKQGEFKLIPLGVAMQIPDGYEAHIVPRSSTFRNWGIIQTNSIGIIDNSYCGDGDQWMMPVYATRDTEIHINDRICQFRIVENQPQIEFEEVESLGNNDRGGFGSTGVR